MKAVTWHGKRDVRVDTVPDPTIEEPTDAIVRDHVDRHLRLRPAPLRGARRRSSTRATSSATSRWASSRRSAPRSTHIAAGRPRRDPVQHLLRALLHVRPRACSRSARRRRSASTGTGAALFGYTKLYGQVPGRPGRVPARAAGAVRPDQGARGPARRPLPLPLRRAADRVAGGRVRRRSPTAARVAVLGLGPDRRDVRAASPSTAAPAQVIGVDLVPGAARARAARTASRRSTSRDARRHRRGASAS